MSSAAITAAGSKLFVSATLPGTYDKAGFEALIWTEVGEVTEIPQFGKVYTIVNHLPLGQRQTIKRGALTTTARLTFHMRLILLAMRAKPFWKMPWIAITLTLSALTLKPCRKISVFSAQCTSRPITVGATDSIVMANTSLAIDDDVLIEDAF